MIDLQLDIMAGVRDFVAGLPVDRIRMGSQEALFYLAISQLLVGYPLKMPVQREAWKGCRSVWCWNFFVFARPERVCVFPFRPPSYPKADIRPLIIVLVRCCDIDCEKNGVTAQRVAVGIVFLHGLAYCLQLFPLSARTIKPIGLPAMS